MLPQTVLLMWTLVFVGGRFGTALGTAEPARLAIEAWQQGQEQLLRGNTEAAIACYQSSLALDPGLVRNHLSLAAAYLEKGDTQAARVPLAKYVAAQPDQLGVRAQYAELLVRLGRLGEARHEFERVIERAQEQGSGGTQQMIHCHRRLMDIAQATENVYGEHLHRGIGLYLLAMLRAELPDPGGDLPVEGLLCKAAAELTFARRNRPDEARPNLYLYEIWSHLSQRQPALRCLRAAELAYPFSYLSPAEQRRLQWACRETSSESISK